MSDNLRDHNTAKEHISLQLTVSIQVLCSLKASTQVHSNDTMLCVVMIMFRQPKIELLQFLANCLEEDISNYEPNSVVYGKASAS